MEEDKNWVDKPSEERNLTNRSRGARKSSMHTLKSTRREGISWGNCVEVKKILPCVGCVGIVGVKLDRSCRGIHSSVVELTSVAILPFHCLSSLINPIVDWLGWTLLCFVYVWTCYSLVPCGNHAQLRGGSCAEGLMRKIVLWLGGTLQWHS